MLKYAVLESQYLEISIQSMFIQQIYLPNSFIPLHSWLYRFAKVLEEHLKSYDPGK